jgi:hypothetical protein
MHCKDREKLASFFIAIDTLDKEIHDFDLSDALKYQFKPLVNENEDTLLSTSSGTDLLTLKKMHQTDRGLIY